MTNNQQKKEHETVAGSSRPSSLGTKIPTLFASQEPRTAQPASLSIKAGELPHAVECVAAAIIPPEVHEQPFDVSSLAKAGSGARLETRLLKQKTGEKITDTESKEHTWRKTPQSEWCRRSGEKLHRANGGWKHAAHPGLG